MSGGVCASAAPKSALAIRGLLKNCEGKVGTMLDSGFSKGGNGRCCAGATARADRRHAMSQTDFDRLKMFA